MIDAMLRVTGLQLRVGKKHILRGIDFAAAAGNITVLLGPNGAGKTTLLKTLIGFNQLGLPSLDGSNSIIFNHELINQQTIYQRVALGMGYVPQQSSLFQDMSVLDNLTLVAQHHDYWQQRSQADFIAERNELLEHMKLMHTLPQMVTHLSGGQQRKVEIVRALLMHPKLIMFDEPFAGVDPKSIYELKDIFVNMAKQGIAVIISDHHVDQLLSCADIVYVMLQGQVVTSGSVSVILQDKQTKDHYLGNAFYTEMSERFLP